MKKLLFITGTRADYGKIKSLISSVERSSLFEAYVFVSGMHLLEKYGSTYMEVQKDGYKNIYVDFSQTNIGNMSYDLGNVIQNLTAYVMHIKPDMIVVHGDRIDALAGAIVGALNNILVAHIEGGEVSGTIDESTRHAISKYAHIHFVCNEVAKRRLIQLGEESNRIFVIGSPDIDILISNSLPSIEDAKSWYEISFEKWGILMYHPVTTEVGELRRKIREVVDAVISSKRNYIVIYPNNDMGTDIILNEYERLRNNNRFRLYPSIRFEYFLTLLRHSDFMIGNSSAGVRETGVYGIPSIDIGSRQKGRYLDTIGNIQHVNEDETEILNAIDCIDNYRIQSFEYGKGNSTEQFMEIVSKEDVWKISIQKKFIDCVKI